MRLSNKGFSLVELMIVVAIIGILAAIAIPNFMTMQLKAKRAEVPGNVDGIKTAELAYDAAFDGFVNASPFPTGGGAGKQQIEWTVGSSGGFASIGWSPDGKVRGIYDVVAGNTDFTVSGYADVDDDDNQTTWTATTSINATMVSNNDIY